MSNPVPAGAAAGHGRTAMTTVEGSGTDGRAPDEEDTR